MYYQNFPISFILILNFILFYLYIVVWALYLVSLLCTHTHMHTHVIYYDFQFSGFLWDSEHANEWFSASVFVLCAFSWVLFLLLVCFVMFQCISFVLFILLYFIIISQKPDCLLIRDRKGGVPLGGVGGVELPDKVEGEETTM